MSLVVYDGENTGRVNCATTIFPAWRSWTRGHNGVGGLGIQAEVERKCHPIQTRPRVVLFFRRPRGNCPSTSAILCGWTVITLALNEEKATVVNRETRTKIPPRDLLPFLSRWKLTYPPRHHLRGLPNLPAYHTAAPCTDTGIVLTQWSTRFRSCPVSRPGRSFRWHHANATEDSEIALF